MHPFSTHVLLHPALVPKLCNFIAPRALIQQLLTALFFHSLTDYVQSYRRIIGWFVETFHSWCFLGPSQTFKVHLSKYDHAFIMTKVIDIILLNIKNSKTEIDTYLFSVYFCWNIGTSKQVNIYLRCQNPKFES